MHGIAVLRMDDIMAYNYMGNTITSKELAEEARRQFGWTDDECVLGGEEITLDETKFNPPSTPTAVCPSFEPKGTLEDWKVTVDFYNDNLSYIVVLARRLVSVDEVFSYKLCCFTHIQ